MMEMICNCAIGNVFIDKEELAAVARSTPIKRHKIFVAQASKDLNFIHELLYPLTIAFI
jgi:hypothetical protein